MYLRNATVKIHKNCCLARLFQVVSCKMYRNWLVWYRISIPGRNIPGIGSFCISVLLQRNKIINLIHFKSKCLPTN